MSPPVRAPRPHRRSCAALLCTALAACGGPAEFLRRPETPITWPPDQDGAPIELVLSYHGNEDVARHPGLFASLFELIAGEEQIQLVSPNGMAVTASDVLWIADPGVGGVHRLSLVSGDHEIFTGPEEQPLRTPVGLAIVPDGRVFITDSSTSRVVVLNPSGEFANSFGVPEEIERPTGIAYDPVRTRLLVLDTTGCRIVAYDLSGAHIESAGTRGEEPAQFNYPTNIALAPDGRIFVTDSMNFRVQVLTPDFAPLSSFGIAGRGPGTFASPKGVALDTEGHVYVVDAMFDNVQIFDPDGQLLLPFSARGSDLGKLFLPSGIHIDDKNRIFVADSGNARVQIFRYLGRKP